MPVVRGWGAEHDDGFPLWFPPILAHLLRAVAATASDVEVLHLEAKRLADQCKVGVDFHGNAGVAGVADHERRLSVGLEDAASFDQD